MRACFRWRGKGCVSRLDREYAYRPSMSSRTLIGSPSSLIIPRHVTNCTQVITRYVEPSRFNSLHAVSLPLGQIGAGGSGKAPAMVYEATASSAPAASRCIPLRGPRLRALITLTRSSSSCGEHVFFASTASARWIRPFICCGSPRITIGT